MIKRRSTSHVKKYLDSSKVKRRRKRRKVILISLLSILSVTACFGFVHILSLPQFQLKEIKVTGLKKVDGDMIQNAAKEEVAKHPHFFGLIPYTSTFLINDSELEKYLSTTFPRIKSIKVSSHLNGVLAIDVKERNPLGRWCESKVPRGIESVSTSSDEVPLRNEASTEGGAVSKTPGCFDLGVDGYIFGASENQDVNVVLPDTYTFKGIVEDEPLGKYYLNEELLTRTVSFLKFLREKGKQVAYIDCASDSNCSIYLKNESKIILNISEDLEETINRFEVALETPSLNNDQYDYVDLRYGNKIFFKGKGSTVGTSTDTPSKPSSANVREAVDSVRSATSSTSTDSE